MKFEVERLSMKLGTDEFRKYENQIETQMPLKRGLLLPGVGNNLNRNEFNVAMKFINRTNNVSWSMKSQ